MNNYLKKSAVVGLLTLNAGMFATPVLADWVPTDSIEFIVTSSPGGGTDLFTRTIQNAIQNNSLLDKTISLNYKGGANGAEGLQQLAQFQGNPHKLAFATSNAWMLPLTAELGYQMEDLTPLAAMAFDEFVIWVNAESEFKNVEQLLDAAREKPQEIIVGGGKSRDTDHVFTLLIQEAANVEFNYVPFSGGSAAAVQLAGGHTDVNTNNPAENISQWDAGQVLPLCVASETRMNDTGIIAQDKTWADLPTCKEEGLDVVFRMPRTVFLPSGVTEEQLEFWVGVMKEVSDTEEWENYIRNSALTSNIVAGADFSEFIAEAEAVGSSVFDRAGWLK